MLANVNIEEVKQYNAALKQHRDNSSALKAQIEYTNKELDNLCAELSTELGIQVTRGNISQIYDEQVAKINSSLQSGKAVLNKIANSTVSSEFGVQQNQVFSSDPQVFNNTGNINGGTPIMPVFNMK